MRVHEGGGMEKTNANVSVFLLMEDAAAARDISSIFRHIGIIPQYFSSLHNFWQALLEEDPALGIVDVKKMSEGHLILQNHPKIKSESLPLAFFYHEASKPLLRSTKSLFFLGVIKEGSDYKNGLSIILKRVNKMGELKLQKKMLQERVGQLEEEIKAVKSQLQENKRKEGPNQYLVNLSQNLAKISDKEDFVQFCAHLLGSWESILSFSYLELGHKGQKLISPEISPVMSNEKYRKIPSLWLTRACNEGMEFFAQNLAIEAAMDILGDDCIPVLIYGQFSRPHAILFLHTTPEWGKNFSWSVFETLLSGVFCRFSLKHKGAFQDEIPLCTPWEMLQLLDDYFYNAMDFKKQLINVNFTVMTRFILELAHVKFDWKNFFLDLISTIQNQAPFNFKISCFGVQNMAFLVDPKDADPFTTILKRVIQNLPFGQYVDCEKSIPWSELLPHIKKVPLSSNAYLKIMEGLLALGKASTKRISLSHEI